MKVLVEISDASLRKVSSLMMLTAKEDEIEDVEDAIRRAKEAKEPFTLDTSLLEEQEGNFEVVVLAVLINQMLKKE